MSPALYLELLQTRRSGWKIHAFAFVGSFLARLLLPSVGTLIAVLAVIPQACAGLGIGTFSEELAKGQLRFLYALPVPRWSVWWIKLASGLAGALCVAVASFAGLWLAQRLQPTEDAMGLTFLLDLLDLAPARVLPALAAYTFYGYAAGLFAVLFCRETKHAQLLNIPFAYAPFAFVAFVVLPLLGTFPSPETLAGAFALAGIVLLFAAQRLFVRRNPFDERVRLWPIAVGGTVIAATLFIAATLAAGTLGNQRRVPRPDRVLTFQAAPDGGAVFLLTGGITGSSSYLLDADGRVAADLGEDAMAMPTPEMWSPDRRRLFFVRMPTPTLVEAVRGTSKPASPSAVVFDRTTGTLVAHPLSGPRDEAPPRHLGWTAAGQPLLLSTHFEKKRGLRHRLHLMDPASGRLETLPELDTDSTPLLVDGRLLVYEAGKAKPEDEARELALFALATRRESRVQLPAGVADWAIGADGRRLLVATREVDETSVSLRVSLVDVATGTSTPLLGPPDLPSATLADAARRELGWVTLMRVRGTPWVRCEAETEGQPSRSWLFDLGSEPVRPVAADPGEAMGDDEEDEELGAGGLRTPSPDGRRLLSWTAAGAAGEPTADAAVVTVQEFGPGGLRVVGTHRLAGHSPAWYGNERLLYLRPRSGDPGFGQSELWLLELRSGEQRRFFGGERAPAPAAR